MRIQIKKGGNFLFKIHAYRSTNSFVDGIGFDRWAHQKTASCINNTNATTIATNGIVISQGKSKNAVKVKFKSISNFC